jgi:hypothetical protein
MLFPLPLNPVYVVKYNMLLTNRTHEVFGYHIDEIKPCSTKPILIQCDFCLKEFSRRKVQMRKEQRSKPPHACVSCDQIKSNWKNNNKNNLSPVDFFLSYPKKGHASVNEEETLRRFGYTSSQLGPKSQKPIVCKCDFCNNGYVTNLQSIKRGKRFTTCKSCLSISVEYSRVKSLQDKHEFYHSKRPVVDFSMVDIDLTLEKFGYDPRLVSPFSERKLVAKCCYCSTLTDTRFEYLTKQKFKITCKRCRHKKTIETLMNRYGVSTTLAIPGSGKKRSDPSTEVLVADILKNEYNIDFVRNYFVGPYSFDFYVPSHNLLVEIQGDFFHKFKKFGYNGTPRDNAKSTYIEKYTKHKLVWIWEHELHIGRTKSILDANIMARPNVEFDSTKLKFFGISIKDAHIFLSIHGYLGSTGTAALPFGAYYGDKLVGVCVFGGVTGSSIIKETNSNLGTQFKPNQFMEVRRFCFSGDVKSDAANILSSFIKVFENSVDACRILVGLSDPVFNDSLFKDGWVKITGKPKSHHYFDSLNNKAICSSVVRRQAHNSHVDELVFSTKSGLTRVEETYKSLWAYILNKIQQ